MGINALRALDFVLTIWLHCGGERDGWGYEEAVAVSIHRRDCRQIPWLERIVQ